MPPLLVNGAMWCNNPHSRTPGDCLLSFMEPLHTVAIVLLLSARSGWLQLNLFWGDFFFSSFSVVFSPTIIRSCWLTVGVPPAQVLPTHVMHTNRLESPLTWMSWCWDTRQRLSVSRYFAWQRFSASLFSMFFCFFFLRKSLKVLRLSA